MVCLIQLDTVLVSLASFFTGYPHYTELLKMYGSSCKFSHIFCVQASVEVHVYSVHECRECFANAFVIVKVAGSVCVFQVGLLDLEVNTLSKILCIMVVILSLIMMIIKVRLSFYSTVSLHMIVVPVQDYCICSRGCFQNNVYSYLPVSLDP